MSVFPSQVNFVTGDILTATAVNEIGQAINLLDGAQWSAGKNRVINAAMQVAQYGTSTALSSSKGYACDRWKAYVTGTNATISRVATGDTTNLPNIQYAARLQRNNGQTSTGIFYLANSFESLNSIPLAGKAVVFSFYARAGANFSAASNALSASLYSGTGTDQNWIDVAYTGQATVAGGTATLTTTWQRFTFTGTVAATATELAVVFSSTPTGTAGAADFFEVTGVQVEASSATVASQFATNQATYQAELAACQRYFNRQASGDVRIIAVGAAASTTSARNIIPFPVEMRVVPSMAVSSGTHFSYVGVATCTGVTLDGARTTTKAALVDGAVAAGLVAAGAYSFVTSNASATLDFSAEL